MYYRILSILFLVIMTDCYADSPMHREMEKFLESMPPNQQTYQANAIRSAINGDFGMLEQLRNSRMTKIELLENVDTLRVRKDILLFYPSNRQSTENLPLLIYLHGGGWTFGSINSCSRFCSALASKNIIVAAIDYLLAPEHSYNQVINSVDDAVDYIIAHAAEWGSLSNAVSLGGDSSGGNLALSCALRKPSQLKSLVIFYPVTDIRSESTAYSPYSKGFGNDSILMEAFRDSYIGVKRTDQLLPKISPIQATNKQLADLPPILMATAECDILCEQGREFAQRVSSVGGKVRYIELKGTTHLFITVPGQQSAFDKAVSLAADFLY